MVEMNPPFECIICNAPHNEMWGTHPAMYCGLCAILKRESKGVVTHVMGNLYLGDIFASKTFDGERLCVHENPDYAIQHHMPYLTTPPNSPLDRTGAVASLEKLDEIAHFILERLSSGIKIITHCKGGVERSPLAITHFLVKTNFYSSYDEAYEFLISIRPVVSKRLFWLP